MSKRAYGKSGLFIIQVNPSTNDERQSAHDASAFGQRNQSKFLANRYFGEIEGFRIPEMQLEKGESFHAKQSKTTPIDSLRGEELKWSVL